MYTYRILKHYNVFGYNDTGMVESLRHGVGSICSGDVRDNNHHHDHIHYQQGGSSPHNLSHEKYDKHDNEFCGIDVQGFIASSSNTLKNGFSHITSAAAGGGSTLPTTILGTIKKGE